MIDDFESAAVRFDHDLIDAIRAINESHWDKARESLSRRLENVQQLGSERLNLFLLAATALLSGHQEVGLQLRSQAEKIPCGMGEPRYLSSSATGPASEVLLKIEMKWWKFNNWRESEVPNPPDPGCLKNIDWKHIVETTMIGDHRALENRWADHLNTASAEKRFLVNFFALAYLIGGDSSTYEDMKSQAVIRSDIQPPPELIQALETRRLHSASECLKLGRWVTFSELETASVLETRLPKAASFENFVERYTEAFTNYRHHKLGAAQQILRQMDPSVNALSLSQELLASILQSAISVKDGDHVSLQFHQDRLKDLQSLQGHDKTLLALGSQLFSGNGQVGVESFLRGIASGVPVPFDPWNAFETF